MVSCTTLSISVRGKIVLHNARAPSLPPTTSVNIKRRVGVFTLSRVVCCIVVRTPAATENMHFSGGTAKQRIRSPTNPAASRTQPGLWDGLRWDMVCRIICNSPAAGGRFAYSDRFSAFGFCVRIRGFFSGVWVRWRHAAASFKVTRANCRSRFTPPVECLRLCSNFNGNKI